MYRNVGDLSPNVGSIPHNGELCQYENISNECNAWTVYLCPVRVPVCSQSFTFQRFMQPSAEAETKTALDANSSAVIDPDETIGIKVLSKLYPRKNTRH